MMDGKIFLRLHGLLSALAAVSFLFSASADDHMFSSMSDEGMTLYCPFDAKSDGMGGGRAVKAVPSGNMKERFVHGLRDGAFAAGCRKILSKT